ncbi:MAG: acylphosphatase, partial [Acidobacteriota bacterium]
MQAKRYLVRGRVQGVGFRYFVWREAEAPGVAGWVRNMADGSVEVVAAASADTLDLLMRRL